MTPASLLHFFSGDLVVDHKTHYFDLREAQKSGKFASSFEYRAKQAYKLEDMSPNSWYQAVKRSVKIGKCPGEPNRNSTATNIFGTIKANFWYSESHPKPPEFSEHLIVPQNCSQLLCPGQIPLALLQVLNYSITS